MVHPSAPGRRRHHRTATAAAAAVTVAVLAAAAAVGAVAVPRAGGAAAAAAAAPAAARAAAAPAAAAAADNETDADDTKLMVMDQVIHDGDAAVASASASASASTATAAAAAPASRQVLTRRPQIVNGVTETRPALTGFMARLLKAPRRGGGAPRFTCGGARITERHVLTAGHCAPTVGDTVAIGGTDVAGGLRYLVVKVSYPPGGSVVRADVGVLDIAVVEYESRTPLGGGGVAAAPVDAAAAAAGAPSVAAAAAAAVTAGGTEDPRASPPPVQLSDLRIARVPRDAGDLAVNTSVTTLGWGAVFPEKIGALFGPAPALRSVNTRVWDGGDCSAAYASVAASRPPYMFCAAAAGAGPCAGDSGGPAGYFPGDGRGFIVVGLVSGTISSLFYRCEPRAPAFYTNVGFFYEWLTDAVAPLQLTS